jgi:hypothetical protein
MCHVCDVMKKSKKQMKGNGKKHENASFRRGSLSLRSPVFI